MINRRAGGFTVLRVGAACALASFFATLAFACVDPKGDFEAYVERTNTMRGVVPDTGALDAPAFEVGDADLDAGTAVYFTSCLPKVFAGAPELSLILLSEVTLSGGKISFTNYPLREDATTLTKAQTLGAPHSAMGVPIKMDNSYVANVGAATVPGKSQRISDNDLTLADLVFKGRILGKERICAELDGRATAPTAQDFNEPGDICISVLLPEGANLPMFKDASGKDVVGFAGAEYHCP